MKGTIMYKKDHNGHIRSFGFIGDHVQLGDLLDSIEPLDCTCCAPFFITERVDGKEQQFYSMKNGLLIKE